MGEMKGRPEAKTDRQNLFFDSLSDLRVVGSLQIGGNMRFNRILWLDCEVEVS
jgi:hypothetical protein